MRHWPERLSKPTARGTGGADPQRLRRFPRLSGLGQGLVTLLLLLGVLGLGNQAAAQVSITQITSTTGDYDYSSRPSISADGTRIAFALYMKPGGDAEDIDEIFRWTQGVGITQITSFTEGLYLALSSSADGTRIAFASWSDLTGGNLDGNVEIFLWTQGVGFTQITDTTEGVKNGGSAISADGRRIAFSSVADLTGGNPDRNREIFLWTQGVGLTQITNSTAVGNHFPSINADGTRIAFNSDFTIFLWTEGADITQISTTTGGLEAPSINADGTRIAFNSDVTIFLWTQGVGITQITTTGWAREPSINADGTRIAFLSDGDLTGGNPDRNQEIFLWTQGVGFTQITSTTGSYRSHRDPSINADGTRIAFASDGDLTGGNPDRNQEIFLWTQAGVGCSYSLSATSQSFPVSGGSGSVGVVAPTGCAWTASSSAAWLTITGGSSGDGNGTVSFSVAANSSTSSRQATITVQGQVFTVTQVTIAVTSSVVLNRTSVRTGDLLRYNASIGPASLPEPVDIYLGALLPDGVTFFSLVETGPGTVSPVLGPGPVPFRANVQTGVIFPFEYTFTGSEPLGTYFTYAGVARAGRDPLQQANQLAVSIASFTYVTQ